MAKRLIFLINYIVIISFITGCASFQLGKKSKIIQPEAIAVFNDRFAGILKDFVDSNGLVDYDGLKQKQDELKTLAGRLGNLQSNEYQSWSKQDKTAFWINVYNLRKLMVVSDYHPISSSSRFLNTLWGPGDLRNIETAAANYKFLVIGKEYTFARIIEQLSSDEFNDPRIFLAISDACLSSPPLSDGPYYGYELNKQLDEQAKRFLSRTSAFQIDKQNHLVNLSALFEYGRYGKVFIKKYGTDKKFTDKPPVTRAVLRFISNYISRQDVAFLEANSYTVKYMVYDWTINDNIRKGK
jgi:hypothetical protein